MLDLKRASERALGYRISRGLATARSVLVERAKPSSSARSSPAWGLLARC